MANILNIVLLAFSLFDLAFAFPVEERGLNGYIPKAVTVTYSSEISLSITWISPPASHTFSPVRVTTVEPSTTCTTATSTTTSIEPSTTCTTAISTTTNTAPLETNTAASDCNFQGLPSTDLFGFQLSTSHADTPLDCQTLCDVWPNSPFNSTSDLTCLAFSWQASPDESFGNCGLYSVPYTMDFNGIPLVMKDLVSGIYYSNTWDEAWCYRVAPVNITALTNTSTAV